MPNKWYKIEKERCDTFTWQSLKQNFIKDFSFLPENKHLQPPSQQVLQFLETNKLSKTIENKTTNECRQVLVEEAHQSTRLQLEIDHFPGKSFQLKKDHPLGKTKVKTLYKISTEKKSEQDNTKEEKKEKKTPPPRPPPCLYSEIKEGKRDINESQALEWMEKET